MKRLPILGIAVLLLALVVVGCNNIPAPPSVPSDDQAAVDVAVEATLTAIAGSENSDKTPAPQAEATAAPVDSDQADTSTPEAAENISATGLVLPPSITDFDPAARPAATKGEPDAPVVIYEWSDYT